MGKLTFDSNGYMDKLAGDQAEQKEKKEKLKQKWKGKKDKKDRRSNDAEFQAKKEERKAQLSKEVRELMVKATKEREARKLFVKFTGKKFPETIEEIKSLNPAIKSLMVPESKRVLDKNKYPNQSGKYPYAHLWMESEEAAESVKKDLESKKFNGAAMIVDYTGEKAGIPTIKEDTMFHPIRLQMFGMKEDIEKDLLKKMFPRCYSVAIPKKGRRNAFIQFNSPEDAKEAFLAGQDLQIGPYHIDISYAAINDEYKERFMDKLKKKEAARKEFIKEKIQEEQRKEQEEKIKRNLGDSDSEDENESPAKKKKKDDDDSNDDSGSEMENDDDDSGDDYENDGSDDE